MHDAVHQAQAWLEAHESDLIEATQAMLRVPSLESAAEPNAPFGPANREALDLALQQAQTWGMETRDLEGYGGWAEIGQGEKLVMTLGHLDVVPVSTGWNHEPFGAEIDGEYLYARGATDDKGPTMAAFFAVRALQATGAPLPCRLRAFFGCNEESGFKCVERYRQTEELPTLGVAPDSGWPCYHAEKGIANATVRIPLPAGQLALLEMQGGERHNIVIDHVRGRVRVDETIREAIEDKVDDYWDANVDAWFEDDDLVFEATGKAAHGSTPFMGDSAATRAFRFLHALAPAEEAAAYEAFLESTHPSGVGLGLHASDEPSKDLTCNLGIVRTDGAHLEMLFNVRYPVTWTQADFSERLSRFIDEHEGWSLKDWTASDPLYFPLDHVLTRTVVEVYEAETGEKKAPGVMGGGTYARALPNCVSIGTGWAGDGLAHENDERIKVSHLLKMAKIYAHLFWRLCEEATR